MNIDVDVAHLQASADSMRAEAKTISNLIGQLDSAAKILSGAWAGDAQQAFLASYSRARGGFVNQVRVLHQAAAEMDSIAGLYAQTDQAGAAAVPH